jgi:hypothetical protein
MVERRARQAVAHAVVVGGQREIIPELEVLDVLRIGKDRDHSAQGHTSSHKFKHV